MSELAGLPKAEEVTSFGVSKRFLALACSYPELIPENERQAVLKALGKFLSAIRHASDSNGIAELADAITGRPTAEYSQEIQEIVDTIATLLREKEKKWKPAKVESFIEKAITNLREAESGPVDHVEALREIFYINDVALAFREIRDSK